MKFLLVCGGTAGHINPALAIADRLRMTVPGSEFLFVGTGRELENKLIPAAGYRKKDITITGISRKISFAGLKQNIGTLRNLNKAKHESTQILTVFNPDIVIGTGGYVCYPVLKQAARMRIPTVIHESNAIPGLTTKMLSKKVDRVLVAFPDTSGKYKDPGRVIVTGTPVRSDFAGMTKAEAKKRLGVSDKPLVVSFWGSLGASHMNDMMADVIKKNCESGVMHHIHATGGGSEGLEKMMKRLKDRDIDELPSWVDIRPYIDDMGTVMTAADLVLCRSGASTLAELTALGCPSLLVPSPNVVDNHQEKNARAIERAGGAAVMTEAECTGDALYNKICELLNDPERLERMSEKAESLGEKDAVSKITGIILSLVN